MPTSNPNYNNPNLKALLIESATNEAALISLIENTSDNIWSVDDKFAIVTANHNFLNAFNAAYGKILEKGDKVLDYIPEDIRPTWEQRYLKAVNGERFQEVDFFDFSAYVVYVEVSFNPIIVDGTIIGVSVFSRDVTTQKLSEKALKEANAMKSKLFSIIAHDLRSPFNTLLGFTQILSTAIEEKDYENTLQYSKIIHKSAENIYALLNNLLDWSNTQIGRNSFYLQNVLISQVVGEVEGVLKSALNQKDISLVQVFDPTLEIRCDKNMISTILRNLISNAVKFSYPQGAVYIRVSEQADMYLFEIQDKGVGMTPEQCQNVLAYNEPFISVGTNNEKGTGLGLMLCKEFIEQHKGTLSVESKKDFGTSFFFTIPK